MESSSKSRPTKRALAAGALAVAIVASIAAACAPPEPRAPHAIGDPVPSATTSAEPLWLRNRP